MDTSMKPAMIAITIGAQISETILKYDLRQANSRRRRNKTQEIMCKHAKTGKLSPICWFMTFTMS